MRLNVISDGTNMGTKIVDIDTGEVVEGVRSVELKFAAQEEPVAVVSILIGDKETHPIRKTRTPQGGVI